MPTPLDDQEEHLLVARELAAVTAAAAAKARSQPEEVFELLDSLEQSLFEITSKLRSPTPSRTIDELLKEALLNNALGATGGESCVPTGSGALDHILAGGWHPGTVAVVVGGQTPTTILVYRLALAAAKAGVGTLLCTPALRAESAARRILALRAGLEPGRVDKARRRITEAGDQLAGVPLHLDDDPYPAVSDIRYRCRRLKAGFGLGLVVVDHVGLIARRTEDQTQLPQEVIDGIHGVAREMDV